MAVKGIGNSDRARSYRRVDQQTQAQDSKKSTDNRQTESARDSYQAGGSATAAQVADAQRSSAVHAVDPQAAQQVAHARVLVNTGATITTADTNARLTTQAATTLAQNLDTLGSREQAVARQQISDAFIRDPRALDTLMSSGSVSEKQAVAMATFDGFVRQGKLDPEFANSENYGRIVAMAEAIDPKASSQDITRALRQQYYSNDQLQVDLAGINVGKHNPSISQDLQGALQRADLRGGWKDLKGPNGKTLDISHSLVALDAYNSSPGLIGRLKSQLFTDVGDLATGVLSAFGFSGAGGFNMPDLRGNNLGDELVKIRMGDNAQRSLSEMLRQSSSAYYGDVPSSQPRTTSPSHRPAPSYQPVQQHPSTQQRYEDEWAAVQNRTRGNDLEDDW